MIWQRRMSGTLPDEADSSKGTSRKPPKQKTVFLQYHKTSRYLNIMFKDRGRKEQYIEQRAKTHGNRIAQLL